MQEPINRRRFLALSANITPLTEVGGALDHFSPLLSEIAFTLPVPCEPCYDTPPVGHWADSFFRENDTMIHNNHHGETLLLNDHAVEPT